MIIDSIISRGLKKLAKMNNINYRIDNIILGKSIYTMKNCDKVFADMNFCLLQLEQGYGFSYFQEEINYYNIPSYVNEDLREVLKTKVPTHLKIAIADAIYSLINNQDVPQKYLYFNGDLRNKAIARAQKIIEGIPSGSRVILLGAVTEIIEECIDKNIEVLIFDLEPSKIGQFFNGLIVRNYKDLDTIVDDIDYVIATGMVFVSDTADILLQKAKENRFSLIFYLETGSNFGEELLQYGAHKVLSEFFPYYDFSGPTRYRVYEKPL